MTDEEIKRIIKLTVDQTVDATVLKLKAAGLLQDDIKTAYEKTEVLLYQYPKLREVNEPYARRVVQEIDDCLAAVENDPYADVIRLYYFGGLKNAACAKTLCCDERTCRRNRRKLVEQFAVRLASEEFIRELLL